MDAKDSYRTIRKTSSGLFRDRGSKFLSFAYQVHSTEEIKEILAKLRREYHDANHHCYAYMLGAARETYRVNDDGEPTSSAGKPILGQIQSHDLSNILIVVIRYFGGTLLGVGGLINAYRTAAGNALKDADIIQQTENEKLILEFPYSAMNSVMKIIDENLMKIHEREFTESCRITVSIRRSHLERITSLFLRLDGVKVLNSY